MVASGLDNPRGLTWANGRLLIAESGTGGDGPCTPGVFAEEICFGPTGAITEVKHGRQRRIVSGLPSIANPDGTFAYGPSDVSTRGGHLYASMGGPGEPEWREDEEFLGGEPLAQLLGTVQRIHGRHWRTAADIAAFTGANDPDGGLVESNTNSVLATRHGLLVADSAGNTLLSVDKHGTVSLITVFETRTQNGTTFEAVPTNLAVGPDGAVYISTLTGFPFPQEQAIIWRWDGHSVTRYAEGFTTAVDLAFGPDGSLYVVELRGLLDLGDGRVVRQAPNGTRTVVADGLSFPTGIAVSHDSLYVSNCGVCAGTGEVRRYDL